MGATAAVPAHVCAQQLDLFDPKRWPRKPFCSDDLEYGIYPRSLASAIKRKYIQANPPHLRVWSIYDLDYSGAAFAWEAANLPAPSWAAVNRENGHAHLAYGLSAPVLVDSPDMRQAPMRYLCAVEAAFRTTLKADLGYSGLITKNPAHPLWKVLRGHTHYYELSYLAEFIDLKKFTPKNGVKIEEIGLMRNVTLFDWLRKWAYKNVRHYKNCGLKGWNDWLADCNMKALERNGEFINHLDGREVWHITKSVAKWTYRTFDIDASDAKFSKLQAHRGAKGGKASGESRLMVNEDKRVTARLMRVHGTSQQTIADELGVSQMSVCRWLRET